MSPGEAAGPDPSAPSLPAAPGEGDVFAGDGGETGRFVVVEGVEGAGKTTQVARLVAWLRDRGIRCVTAREPGGTAVGEAIRTVVLDGPDLPVPAETELLLILAARAAFVREVVRPALARGDTVVADRYDLSTLAYQGWGRGLDLETVRRLNDFATGGLEADLVLVLDVPVPVGRERQKRAGKTPDRMERQGTEFLERVRAGYREEARRNPAARLVDATGSPEEVHQAVVGHVRRELGG